MRLALIAEEDAANQETQCRISRQDSNEGCVTDTRLTPARRYSQGRLDVSEMRKPRIFRGFFMPI